MPKNKIVIPQTKAELSSSHYFNAFIYPQQLESNDLLTSAIYRNYVNIFTGIKKVGKTFKKDVQERRKLGDYEAIQIVPTKLDYSLNLDKVVFYKESMNAIAQFLEIEGNGFIKQLAPFLVQEFIKNPDGTFKEIATYFDCWFTDDKCDVDVNADDLLITKTLSIKFAQMRTKNNNNVGALKDVTSLASSVAQATNIAGEGITSISNFIENFKF